MTAAAALARRHWNSIAFAAALATAIVSTWPLATALSQAIPTHSWHCLGQGCQDEFLCYWIITALGKRLLHAPLSLFEGDILTPLRHSLAYSETMLSAAIPTALVTWITGNTVLAYNLYYLATVALASFGTFLLVRDITDDPRAALVAGLLFSLAGERWNFRGHLAIVAVQWTPFVCWTWIRFLDRATGARALALAAAYLASLHASVYQGMLLPLLLVPWAAVLVGSRRWSPRRWIASAVVIGITLAVGLVAYWPFAVVRDELSFVTSGMAEVGGGWDWYLGPLRHPMTYVQRLTAPDRFVLAMSPLPLLALATATIVAVARRPVAAQPASERAHLLATVAFTVTAAVFTIHPDRLGPLGHPIDVLFSLPGLDGLRGRGRLAILVDFGGAVLLGIALATILRRIRRRRHAMVVVALAAAAVVVDTRTLKEPTPLTWLPTAADIPAALALAARLDPRGGLLQIPYGHWDHEVLYMMWGLHHDRPLMNGYTGIMPRFGPIVRDFPSPASRRALADAGVTHVLIDTRTMHGLNAPWFQRIQQAPLEERLVGDYQLVAVGDPGAVKAPLVGTPIAHDGWRLEGSDPDASLAVDGDLRTHWTTKTIDRPTFLRIDLGSEHRVSGARLAFGPHIRDYPHAWELWGSRDGSNWERLGGEKPTLPPFASYRRDHRNVSLDLPVPPTTVRLVEIRVPPQNVFVFFDGHGDGTWGVHELEIFESSATR